MNDSIKGDLGKIEILLRKDKKFILLSQFAISVILVGLWYAFLLGPDRGNIVALAAMLAFSALCIFCVLRGFVELHPEKDMYPVEEGIRVSPSKNADLNIIRYEWIEVVVMNEAGGGSVYVDIFFTADGKKYIYRTFQRKIKDHGEFLEALREKGVDVRVLEPSIWVQRKRDFTWIGYMMKGREWVR